MNAKLTDTQIAILKAAAGRPDGNIEPLPPTLRGGAKTKVIEGLLARQMITSLDEQYFLTDAAYAAIGRKRMLAAPSTPDPELEEAVTTAEAKWQANALKNSNTICTFRPGTKQAAVIAMLQRPEGATGAQIGAATNWQCHSIRGFISGTIGKKLGLKVVSEKNGAGERTYRIV